MEKTMRFAIFWEFANLASGARLGISTANEHGAIALLALAIYTARLCGTRLACIDLGLLRPNLSTC